MGIQSLIGASAPCPPSAGHTDPPGLNRPGGSRLFGAVHLPKPSSRAKSLPTFVAPMQFTHTRISLDRMTPS